MNNDNTAVIGLQWGDEGKGKVVDYLCKDFDSVVRFNGGNNAGHTIVIDNNIYKLSILPSGVLRGDKLCVIGNGVVLDPYYLIKEINLVKTQGIKVDEEKLFISENCHLILQVHKDLDELFERNQQIGTTKCGIGPCYSDKVARRGIRLYDLRSKELIQNAISRLIPYHNTLRKGFGLHPLDENKIISDLIEIREEILKYSISSSDLNHRLKNKKLLFEGAQGFLLDIDYGTYPFVTSSSSGIGEVMNGTGLDCPANVVGILKCYNTRVGEGVFPTEQKNNIGDALQEYGNEIGTVSRRKRRCGWFDAVLARYSILHSRASSIVLTKIDVLDSFEKIKICNSYQVNGDNIQNCGPNVLIDHNVIPQYIEIDGWNSSTKDIKDYNSLPTQAKYFINTIENILNVPVKMISTGAKRDSLVLKHD
jgi:adenylosuccinate synthase